MEKPVISLIIPFLNEEENLPLICAALEEYKPTVGVPVEVVFVDDGSTDGSCDWLRQAEFRNFTAKLVKFSRNFGSHPAVRAGFMNASAPNCVWLGADLQEPLEIIGEGYRLIRQRRKEFRIMKVIATVLWGITALYLYKNLNQIFQPGGWADLAWEKAPAPVRQWRE